MSVLKWKQLWLAGGHTVTNKAVANLMLCIFATLFVIVPRASSAETVASIISPATLQGFAPYSYSTVSCDVNRLPMCIYGPTQVSDHFLGTAKNDICNNLVPGSVFDGDFFCVVAGERYIYLIGPVAWKTAYTCPSGSTPDATNQCVSCPAVPAGATPFKLDPGGATCSRQNNFTISLSKGNEVEPSNGSSIKTLPFTATILDQSTGQPPTSPIKVHISLKVDSTSGGHAHGSSDRPRGGIASVQTCTSDAECWSNSTVNGSVVFNFNAPEASGKYTITATCDGCANNPQMTTVNVKVDGLAQIPDTSFYTLVETSGAIIGANSKHNQNHYLTPEAATILLYIAASYQVEDKFWQLLKSRQRGIYTYAPAPLLHLNDASLIWGGVFDLDYDWEAPHEEHRRGTVIDIRANSLAGAIPPDNFKEFRKLATFYGADAGLHAAGTAIQHFHVRLLNRKE
jgi:hypothetical protein